MTIKTVLQKLNILDSENILLPTIKDDILIMKFYNSEFVKDIMIKRYNLK